MKKIEAIIFDMDGTLYSFDEKDESQFSSSKFGKQIYANCILFFQEQLGLSHHEALNTYQDLSARYSGEISLAVEKEFGIDRSQYFAYTWNLEVKHFVTSNDRLVPALRDLPIQSGVLTAAPRIWADNVLEFLQIRKFFGEAVFTGEPDIRKPDPLAFKQLADFWNFDPSHILAIGDQELTDILPAKSLGMMTLRIAKQAGTNADLIAPDIISAIDVLKQRGII